MWIDSSRSSFRDCSRKKWRRSPRAKAGRPTNHTNGHETLDHVLGIVGGRPGFLMGTGALPLETPSENIRLIREYLAN
jgi:hypothetical protein